MHGDRESRRRGVALLAAVVVAVGLLAGACASSETGSGGGSEGTAAPSGGGEPLVDEGTPTPGGRLVVGVTAETNGWNPHINQWADAGSLIGSSMVETLTHYDENADIQPFLAKSWTSNDDFTVWDIELVGGVKFQNGEPLDAAAAAASLESSFAPGSLTAVALGPMYDRVEVTGDLTLRVYLQRSWSLYPGAMAQSGWMLAPEMLAAPDKGSSHPIGTGPFSFVSWDPNSKLLVKKNDDYWQKAPDGSALPYLEEIEFRVITDDGQQLNALKANDVDMQLTVSADTAARAEEDGFTVIRDYDSERTFVQLNTAEAEGVNAPNPFVNEHARRAVAYATDAAEIRDLVGPKVKTTTSPFIESGPYGLPNDETDALGYDQEKAKQEIELYKQETGATSLAFSLSALTANLDTKIAQALQEQWKEVGIEAEIEGIEQAKFVTFNVLGDYQASLFRLYGYPDPDTNANFFVSETAKPIGQLSINFTHFVSRPLDEAFADSRITADQARRKADFDESARIINQAAINVWLYNSPYAIIAREGVHGLNGFRQYPFGNFIPKNYWQDVWIQS